MVTISKVILAVDDRVSAQAMEDFLDKLAFPAGTQVKVVHAIEPTEAVSSWPSEQYRIEAEELVASTTSHLSTHFPQLRVQGAVLWGYAEEEIIDLACAWGANLIIVGSHARAGLARLLLGSVAEAVVSHAPCSVLALRHLPKTKEQQVVGCAPESVRADERQDVRPSMPVHPGDWRMPPPPSQS